MHSLLPNHVIPAPAAVWASRLSTFDWPLAADTVASLEDWRPIEDAADAHNLAQDLGQDPLFVLKLFRRIGEVRIGRSEARINTPTEALVLMGIGPFFRWLDPQASTELTLEDHPSALSGWKTATRRAQRAAALARGLALQRQDPSADSVYNAILLHNTPEQLLWLAAPTLAQSAFSTAPDDAPLLKQQVQQTILGASALEILTALTEQWHLPPATVQSIHPEPAEQPALRTNQLSILIAEHSEEGWHLDLLNEELDELARLLRLNLRNTIELVRDLAD